MKVILTGSTGLIGSGVLERCLSHPSITSIVAFTRRPLDSKDPKLKNIIKKDYLNYEQSEIDQMKGAEACIWVLGSPTSGKEVHAHYTTAAITTLLTSIVPQMEKSKPFRFVYTSGGAVPYLESNALFFLGEGRKMRAELDRQVLATEAQNQGRWESFVVRPGFVVDVKPYVGYVLPNAWIYRKELAATMVDLAINGGDDRIINNTALRLQGQEALEKTKL